MKLNRTARNILGITAFAWSIPFAQTGDVAKAETEARRERASTVSVSQDNVSIDRGAGGATGPAGREGVRRFRRVP